MLGDTKDDVILYKTIKLHYAALMSQYESSLFYVNVSHKSDTAAKPVSYN